MSEDQILTQEEIDALLDRADSVAGGGRVVGPHDSQPYDIFNPTMAGTPSLPDLSTFSDRLIRAWARALSRLLPLPPDLSLFQPPEEVKGEDLKSLLVEPIAVGRMRLHGMEEACLIAMDQRLVSAMTGLVFGGDGSVPAALPGQFSHTEQRLASRLVEAIAPELGRLLGGTADGTVVDGLETSVTGIDPRSRYALMTFQVQAGEGSGSLRLAMDPALTSRLNGHSPDPQAGQGWHNHLLESATRARVRLHGRVAEVELTIGDLLSMRPGDFIPLDIDRQVVLCVGQQPVLCGELGVSESQNAVHITGPAIHQDSTESQRGGKNP